MSLTDPDFKRKKTDKQARVSKAVKRRKKKKEAQFPKNHLPLPQQPIFVCFNSVLGFKDQNKKNEREL